MNLSYALSSCQSLLITWFIWIFLFNFLIELKQYVRTCVLENDKKSRKYLSYHEDKNISNKEQMFTNLKSIGGRIS